MRVLSVPQPSTGTVDLVRGHPNLTGGKLYAVEYAGVESPVLCDIEIRGHEVHKPDYSAKKRKGQHGNPVDIEEQVLDTSWFAQV